MHSPRHLFRNRAILDSAEPRLEQKNEDNRKLKPKKGGRNRPLALEHGGKTSSMRKEINLG